MERTIVLVQALHHRQIRTHTQQKHRLTGELAVVQLLERAFEARIVADEIWHLVENDDARTALRYGSREELQRGIPVMWSLTIEER
jgi:hypothetical protein